MSEDLLAPRLPRFRDIDRSFQIDQESFERATKGFISGKENLGSPLAITNCDRRMLFRETHEGWRRDMRIKLGGY